MVIIRKIAIYDTDTEYALSLAEYISEYKTREYKVYVFSADERFYEFIENEKPDIVLADRVTVNKLKEKVDVWSIRDVFILSENREECIKEGKSIYKYQAAEVIVSIIDESILVEESEIKKENKEIKEKSTEGFRVFALVAGAFPLDGVNIALGINHYFGNSFIILDFNRISIAFENREEKRMSECIYLLESDTLGIDEFKECINYKNNMGYIAGINDSADVSCLTIKGVTKLESLSKSLGYKGFIILCDATSAVVISHLVNKKDIVVLEGSGKRVRDFTYNLIKTMNCVGDKSVRLINTDGIRESQLNQIVDYEEDGYEKGGLFKLINEICKS